jgi:hypothetical protein
MKRYMAACASAEHPDGVKLRDLPDERSFDFFELPGGFSMIHNKGVLLIDDWSSEPLDKAAYQQEFRRATQRLAIVRQTNKELANQVQQVRDRLERRHGLSYGKIISRLKLRSELFDTRPLTEDENVLAFRARLQARWGIKAQLNDINDIARQMSSMVRSHVEVRSGYLIRWLTIYGFPFVLFASFFEGIFSHLSV